MMIPTFSAKSYIPLSLIVRGRLHLCKTGQCTLLLFLWPCGLAVVIHCGVGCGLSCRSEARSVNSWGDRERQQALQNSACKIDLFL